MLYSQRIGTKIKSMNVIIIKTLTVKKAVNVALRIQITPALYIVLAE